MRQWQAWAPKSRCGASQGPHPPGLDREGGGRGSAADALPARQRRGVHPQAHQPAHPGAARPGRLRLPPPRLQPAGHQPLCLRRLPPELQRRRLPDPRCAAGRVGTRERVAAGRWAPPPTPSRPPGRGGGFWYTGSHGSVCSDGERAEDFVFEFRERGRLAIRAQSGKYLRGGASGLLRADADAPAGTALWEY